MSTLYSLVARVTLCAGLLPAMPGWAQSAAPNRSSPGVRSDEEVITLPEFAATASSLRDSYLAAETISGTRTGAKIVETPFSVQVLTSEFMTDFQLFDMADQLRFVAGAFPGAEDTGANNGRTLRGFTPPVLRDGFSRANPPDRTTVDRVEVIRGPVSALYGQSSPGGLVNYVSKRPKRTPRYAASAIGGSYSFERYSAEATGPVVKDKLFYYATCTHQNTESDLQYFYYERDLFAAGVTYLLSPQTSVTVAWERQRVHSNQGDTIPVYRVGSFTAGIFWELAKYNIMGPNMALMRDFESGNVLFEHRFSSNVSLRVNLQSYDKDFESSRYRYGSGNTVQPGGTMTAEAFRSTEDIDSDLGQMDLLWKIPGRDVQHAVLFAADFSRWAQRTLNYVVPPVRTSATINRRPTFVINPWAPVWVSTPPAQISQMFQDTPREFYNYGLFASDRLFFWHNRLITFAGLRYDRVERRKLLAIAATRTVSSNDQTPLIDVSDGSGAKDSAISYSVGWNLKLRDDRLVWFANHSTGFEPQVTIDAGTGLGVPNEKSWGIETGFKGAWLDDVVTWTVSAFQIRKTDVAISNPDYDAAAVNRVAQYLAAGKEQSKGYEIDARWSAGQGFYVQAGGAFVDGRVTEPLSQRDRLTKAPRYNAYAASRYAFTGALRGLSIGASMSYTGDYLYNRGSATRFRQVHPAVTLWNGFAAYGWKTGGRLTHKVALNGLNLFDKYYLQDTFRLARGREIRLSYTAGY